MALEKCQSILVVNQFGRESISLEEEPNAYSPIRQH